MPTTIRNFTANESEIDKLLRENASWKKEVAISAEEIIFLNSFLDADVFQDYITGLQEKLEFFNNELENLKTENMDLTMEIHNHRYDIEGMMECEDIGCERFYHDEHLKLEERVRKFLINLKAFELDVFAYTGPLLKKSH